MKSHNMILEMSSEDLKRLIMEYNRYIYMYCFAKRISTLFAYSAEIVFVMSINKDIWHFWNASRFRRMPLLPERNILAYSSMKYCRIEMYVPAKYIFRDESFTGGKYFSIAWCEKSMHFVPLLLFDSINSRYFVYHDGKRCIDLS